MPLTVTRPSFSFTGSKKYYFDNNQLTTHFFNALSATFPAGEQFFVDSVRAFREKLPRTAPFQKDISGFIGQEAMHTIAHNAFNKYATEHGIPLDTLEIGTEHLLRIAKKVLSPRQQLAATVCLEHYTAIMAGKLLVDAKFNERIYGELREMWLWHATEEVAHAHVAWDLYHSKEVGGTYLERTYMMVITSAVFLAAIASMTSGLVTHDAPRPLDFRKGLGYLIGRKGFLTELIPDYLQFFRPSFHPNDHTRGVLNAVAASNLRPCEQGQHQ